MTRSEILTSAETIVNGEREQQYGSPEDNFKTIAELWTAYLNADEKFITLSSKDVAAMMILLKVARIGSGQYKDDNWIDICGYAACGGELQGEIND